MIINDATKLGSGGSNLILETAGKVYIKVADRFYELDFKNPGGKTIRVGSSGEEQEAPEIDMSQYVTKKYLRSALSNYITQRGWEDIQETKRMLENALLDGFTESINPVTVETMQLIVGTESLQFDFIDGLLTGNPRGAGFELMEGNQLRCPDNFIKHHTLDGPSSVRPSTPIQLYSRWTVKNPSEYSDGNTYLELPEDDLSYYVYIRAPKYIDPNTHLPYTDTYVEEHLGDDPKGSEIATYLISQSAIELETNDDPGYYYFLVAIVTSKSNGFRSIGYMNGFTEIVPGQITAYVFKTPDGTQYLDFLNQKFKIGNSNNFLDWNVTTPNTLTIKGSLSATGGEVKESIDRLSGLIGTVWFSSDAPTTQDIPHPLNGETSSNWPANLWTTEELKKAHVGNHYYVESGEESGKTYVYVHNNTDFYWEEANNLDYLTKAIKGRSDLEGGLILTNLIQLGYSTGDPDDIEDYYSKFSAMSGINGQCLKQSSSGLLNYEDLAAWYGGPMVDLEKDTSVDSFLGSNGNTYIFSRKENLAYPYVWTSSGSEVYLQNNPPLDGETFYSYSIDSGVINWVPIGEVVHYTPGAAASAFRMDGTGYLAKGNISWNKDGKLTLKDITVSNSAVIGPFNVTDDEVRVRNGSKDIFVVNRNTCLINGSLKAQSSSYYDPAAIEIIDHSGTKIADIGSSPLSTDAIPTYIRNSDNASFVFTKGTVFWGTVSIPANWYWDILDTYYSMSDGDTYTVTALSIGYNFARISRTITMRIVLRDTNLLTNSHTDTNWYSRSFSSGSPSGTITASDLTTNQITTTFYHAYQLLVYLVEGGQVQSSIASDSWIGLSRDGVCEATITKASSSLDLGTYIRPNGISSVFGSHSKFQWVGAMSNAGGMWQSDYRDQGGTFTVELPATSGGSDSTGQVGLQITGYYDASASTVTGPGIRINLGSGWYKLKIDGDTLKVETQ